MLQEDSATQARLTLATVTPSLLKSCEALKVLIQSLRRGARMILTLRCSEQISSMRGLLMLADPTEMPMSRCAEK